MIDLVVEHVIGVREEELTSYPYADLESRALRSIPRFEGLIAPTRQSSKGAYERYLWSQTQSREELMGIVWPERSALAEIGFAWGAFLRGLLRGR